MASARNLGSIAGTRPGVLPIGEPVREVTTQRRVQQSAADKRARRANRAYGTLNLDQWGEHMVHATALIPTTGRPKKRTAG